MHSQQKTSCRRNKTLNSKRNKTSRETIIEAERFRYKMFVLGMIIASNLTTSFYCVSFYLYIYVILLWFDFDLRTPSSFFPANQEN